MGCHCASAITAEMTDWVSLGGANSGCCGDAKHSYGFHRPGNAVPVTDYSRRHEKARPCDMDAACAGDFSHRNKPALRARHAVLLAALMAGKYPMICEFIGKPWPDRPVYYWARWDGIKTLKRYTGSGHDHWSHISWWRSRCNERAYLWRPKPKPKVKPKPQPKPQPAADVTPARKPTPAKPTPAPAQRPPAGPKFPGKMLEYSPNRYDGDLKVWQARMARRGWQITADGYFGPGTRTVVRKFQAEKRLGVDGKIGPITWRAAWAVPVSR